MTAVFGEGRAREEANVGVYQSQVVVVGLGRRHDGSRIIVSVDAYTRVEYSPILDAHVCPQIRHG